MIGRTSISFACDLSVRDEPRPIMVNACAIFARFSRGMAARTAPQAEDKGEIGAPVLGRAPTAVFIKPLLRNAPVFAKNGKNQGGMRTSPTPRHARQRGGQGKLKGQPIRLATKPGNFEELHDNILLAFFQKHLNGSGQT